MDFERFVKRVGASVRRARWAAEMTQQDLASEVLTLRLLSALERGHGNPTLHTLFALARALDVPVRDLVDVEPADSGRKPLASRKAVQPKRGRRSKRKTTRRA